MADAYWELKILCFYTSYFQAAVLHAASLTAFWNSLEAISLGRDGIAVQTNNNNKRSNIPLGIYKLFCAAKAGLWI